MSTLQRPAHRLALAHSLVDYEAHSRLGRRTGDSQSVPVGVRIVREPAPVIPEVVVQILQVLTKTVDAITVRRVRVCGSQTAGRGGHPEEL
jgi:hypothetical protein